VKLFNTNQMKIIIMA